MVVGNLISGSPAFSKSSLNIWKFSVHVLDPGLENSEHNLASMWNECNRVVVWAFFGIAFLWDGKGNGNPLQYSCLENPMNGGAWWTAVYWVAKSWTRLSDFTFTFNFTFLCDWDENWPFSVLWPLLSFPYLLANWVKHFNSIIF